MTTHPSDETIAPAGWVVAGEALVDLTTEDDGRLRPTPGGSPYNVALGLGRLGVPTRYLGALSADAFGRQLVAGLTAADVDLALATEVDAPTTLAVVHLDEAGHASYGFYLDGTAATALRSAVLVDTPPSVGLHVSFGAVGARHEPTGTALRALIERESGTRLVSLDPNLRASAVGDDVAGYRAMLDALVADCDLVKASDEDLAALGVVDDLAARWAASGPALVVVTRGPGGATAFTGDRRLDLPGRPVEVADTVGAGDAFTAGLLWSLTEAAVTDREALRRLTHDDERVRGLLRDAGEVAARTCERPGADPPTRAQLGPR